MFTADKPLRHVSEDEYGRERYVENLAYAIVTGDDSNGLVVGVEGEWGSGKTSVKNMLIERLQQQMCLPNRRTHIIKFDAWMYSRSGEMISALFSEISEGLSPKLKWYQELWVRFSQCKSKTAISVIQLFFNLLDVAFLSGGVSVSMEAISQSFQNLSEVLSSSKTSKVDSLRRTRDALKYDLRSQTDKIIVFIDDLDRLLDDEVALLMQAVKAVGDLPCVTYVLFYDKTFIAEALNKSSHGHGAEFLEKIIQVPVAIPDSSLGDLRNMLRKEILRAGQRKQNNWLTGRELDIFEQCICPFIHGKRDVVRFLNDFLLYYGTLGDDVELLDLAGITALRIFYPELYQWIKENRDSLVDSKLLDSVDLHDSGRINNLKQIAEFVDETNHFNNDVLNWKKIIGVLFPIAYKAFNEQNGLNFTNDVPDSYRSICKKIHFDVYFRLVPSMEEISEQRYKQFLCVTNLDMVQINADLMQVAYSSKLQGKLERYLRRNPQNGTKRMRMLLRFYLKNHFSVGLQAKQNAERAFYPYVLSLFDVACKGDYSSASIETLLEECFCSEEEGALPANIYLAVLCDLQSLSIQEKEDWRWNKLYEIWDVEVNSYLGYKSQLRSEMDKIDWKKWSTRLSARIMTLAAKQQPQDDKRESLLVHLDFYELRLTMAMLGQMLKNEPDSLVEVLRSLRRYADEDQFVFLSVAALVTKLDDGSYSVVVQAARKLFKPDDYLDVIDTYISKGVLWHKTSRKRDQQLCHAAYAFALRNIDAVDQLDPVHVTADQASSILESWKN